MGTRANNQTTRVEQIKAAAFNHPVIAILLIVFATLIAVGNVADSLDKILVGIGMRRDALDLAAGDAKGEFSRRLVNLAWRRLFWSNTFTARVLRNAPAEDLNEAWKQYTATVADWSAELVTMRQFLNEHYTESRTAIFTEVHTQFRGIHTDMVKLRYEMAAADPASRIEVSRSIQARNDDVNFQLCLLVRGLSKDTPKGKAPC